MQGGGFFCLQENPPDKEEDVNRSLLNTKSQTSCFLITGSIQWLPLKDWCWRKLPPFSELLLMKPGSSFVEIGISVTVIHI